MNGLQPKQEELRSAAMNFRELRNSLLLAEQHRGRPYTHIGNLRTALMRGLDKLTALPKKLKMLQGGDLENEKERGKRILDGVLPGFESEILDWAIHLRSDQDRFRDAVYFAPEEAVLEALERAVTGYEEVVKAYTEKYPRED